MIFIPFDICNHMSSRVTICHIVWPMLPYFYWGFGPSGEALGLCHTVRSLYSLPFGKSGFPFPWLLIRLWGSCDSVAFGCTRWIYGRVHRWATLSSSLTSTQYRHIFFCIRLLPLPFLWSPLVLRFRDNWLGWAAFGTGSLLAALAHFPHHMIHSSGASGVCRGWCGGGRLVYFIRVS